jgi:Spy/CpxP family protein refolding chaperone
MKRPTLAAALYAVLVFLSGVLVGGFGYRLYVGSSVNASAHPSPEDFKRRYMAEMQSRLKLNPDQMNQLSGILDVTRDQYRAFREKHKPEMQAIQDDQVRRINSILTMEQRAEYDKMRQEREKRRREEAK